MRHIRAGVGFVWRAVAVALLFAAGACIDDGSVLCPGADGIRCPASLVCTADGTGCRIPGSSCGDGVVEPGEGEVCDDGNVESGDGCRGDCASNERCGNGTVDAISDNTAGFEECDAGELNSDDIGLCTLDCTLNCGDGEHDYLEECDDAVFDSICLDYGFDWGATACTRCVADLDDCGRIDWERSSDVAGIGVLNAVWGLGPGLLFAAGANDDGTRDAIVRYDPARNLWVSAGAPTRAGAFHGIWGLGDDEVYFVGELGRVLLYDGVGWQALETGVEYALRAVWGSYLKGEALLFAAGDSAAILRYDGRTWRDEALPAELPDDARIAALWGSSPRDVYAVGGAGLILHYDGERWVREAAGLTGADLRDIWGSEGEVFAVGSEGVVLHYDSDGWTIMDEVRGPDTNLPESRPMPTLYAVWGSAPDHVVAVGDQLTMLVYDGNSWSRLNSATDALVRDLWGLREFGLLGVGERDQVFRHYGWSRPSRLARPLFAEIIDLWGRASDDILALTSREPFLIHFDGTEWRALEENHPELMILLPDKDDGTTPLRDMWGDAEGVIHAVGDDSLILRYQPGEGWTQVALDASVPRRGLNSVWGTEAGELYAVGEAVEGEPALILHYDGSAWTQMSNGATATLHSVWAHDKRAFAVGENGTILTYAAEDGGIWTHMNSPTREPLYGVWGAGQGLVRVVGAEGTLLVYAPSTGWAHVEAPSVGAEDLYAIWGSDAEHVFAVGAEGTLLFDNGDDGWTPVRVGTDRTLRSVWGVRSTGNHLRAVMVGGDAGAFDHLFITDSSTFP
ncbi:DUF4215 domain-containing protein [Haliangium ochraceum]|uniref:Cysteine-rich repeat protein n=1 Tax=Haliangium ochraceum (strain DSM 14365 / JCM 11303 / SMP-2) TaxID=502025 RepID=D0LXN1_HALO1|nr:DUF4215 domain-containing protein [Haliangium ochraceum]ACY17786.1 cysteine-rich repeat protein [Haliangium ochraceum DSM 14365]